MKCFYILLLAISLTTADKNPKEIETANNKFAPAVYKQIYKAQKGNIIFSPLSAHQILTLLQTGCKGDTAEQLRAALSLPNDEEKIEKGVKNLLVELKDSTFNLANKIYVAKNFTVKESFEEIARGDFGASCDNLDFASSAQAAETINEWVEKETNDTIKNLIGPQDLSPATVVVLVNALHFNASWSVPFSKSLTQKNVFYKNDTDTVQVDYMYLNRKRFNYYESQTLKAQFVELSFKGNASMVFVLPQEKTGLGRLERQIQKVLNVSIPFALTYLNLQIPKFKFEGTIDFQNVLISLNVTKIFSKSEADLSGIAGKKGNLVVSKVVQKAFIDVNEDGVEAAAATYISITPTAVLGGSPKNLVFNRPFLIMIKEKDTIIFVGRVSEPKY